MKTHRDPAAAVTHWAEQLRTALCARNEAIQAMREAGASLRQIADAAGLSHGAIAKILEKEED